MQIKTPLYRFDARGRFFIEDLNAHTSTPISDHLFTGGMPNIVPSPDGRWVSYSGITKGSGKTEYWLYDRTSKTDHLLFSNSGRGRVVPDFSPDSRYLAMAVNDDVARVMLFDTVSLTVHAVSPPPTSVAAPAWTSTAWSSDGSELLLMQRGELEPSPAAYFSYRLSTQRMEEITGHDGPAFHEHVFVRDRQEIDLFKPVLPKSLMANREAVSPGGQWRARLGKAKPDTRYQLEVVGKNGVSKPLATGSYSHCQGNSLYITGWLDEQHLVYRNFSTRFFVVDVESGTTAELFGETKGPTIFSW
ncbi:hypothetical protein SAMN05428948_2943 [Massilia sp. CF038]|nr:hypothetical protein SAMN05428948_2943 [Massilia sp. CF038]